MQEKSRKFSYLAMDLDGICREHGGDLDQEARMALELLFERGINVIPSSSKPLQYLLEYFSRHGLLENFEYVMSEEGGVIYHVASEKKTYATAHMKDLATLHEEVESQLEMRDGQNFLENMPVEAEAKETGFCLFSHEESHRVRIIQKYWDIIERKNLELYTMKYPDAAAVIRNDAHKLEGLQNLSALWISTSQKSAQ